MTTRRQALLACTASVTGWVAKIDAGSRERVRVSRVSGGGLQPQIALDGLGTLHLVYYAGDPERGDLFYLKSVDGGTTFSGAIRVNSHPGSAIAMSTIRGAQLTVGKDGRVHVSWNGSSDATPAGPMNPDFGKPGMPMLYARLNDAGTAFQPQRNLMRHSFGLDGGGGPPPKLRGKSTIVSHAQRFARMPFLVHRDEHGKLLVRIASDKLFHMAAAPPFQGLCSQFVRNPAAALS